jgi:hypothetical protein
MTTELKLDGKAPLARTLHLRMNVGGHLTASLYVLTPKRVPKSLAFSVMKLADCYLFLGKYDNSALWLGHAAFDVSEAEAQQIRATYEPLGLHIEKEGSIAIKLQSSAEAAVHP